jgi:hypothetical protein
MTGGAHVWHIPFGFKLKLYTFSLDFIFQQFDGKVEI